MANRLLCSHNHRCGGRTITASDASTTRSSAVVYGAGMRLGRNRVSRPTNTCAHAWRQGHFVHAAKRTATKPTAIAPTEKSPHAREWWKVTQTASAMAQQTSSRLTIPCRRRLMTLLGTWDNTNQYRQEGKWFGRDAAWPLQAHGQADLQDSGIDPRSRAAPRRSEAPTAQKRTRPRDIREASRRRRHATRNRVGAAHDPARGRSRGFQNEPSPAGGRDRPQGGQRRRGARREQLVLGARRRRRPARVRRHRAVGDFVHAELPAPASGPGLRRRRLPGGDRRGAGSRLRPLWRARPDRLARSREPRPAAARQGQGGGPKRRVRRRRRQRGRPLRVGPLPLAGRAGPARLLGEGPSGGAPRRGAPPSAARRSLLDPRGQRLAARGRDGRGPVVALPSG
jgi:hypothetical protein